MYPHGILAEGDKEALRQDGYLRNKRKDASHPMPLAQFE